MDFEKCRKDEEEYARFLTEKYFVDRDAIKAVASGVFYEDEITDKLVKLNCREPGTTCYADPEESVGSSKPVTEMTGLPNDQEVSSKKRKSKKSKKSRKSKKSA